MLILHGQAGSLLGCEEGILPAGQLPNPDGTTGDLVPTLSASIRKGWQNTDGVIEPVNWAVLAPSVHSFTDHVFAEPPLLRHLCSNDNRAPSASLPGGKEW